MREHIRLLGILNIVWSSVSLAIGLVVLLIFGGMAGFLSVLGWGSSDNNVNGLIVGPFMAVIGVIVVLVICCVSLPALIGGIGLLKMKGWSRMYMIVISILHLLSFPIGTALGVYGL
jgi:type IV secretory pathway VirB2 component (pilin)